MKNNSDKADRKKLIKAALLFAMTLCIIGISCRESFAGLTGNGSEADPLSGITSAGDRFDAGSWVKNLSETDGALIELDDIYEPKECKFVLDAGKGRFSDGDNKKYGTASYGAELKKAIESLLDKSKNNNGTEDTAGDTHETPEADGMTFAGWYIKGNHAEKKSAEGSSSSEKIIEAGGRGDTVASDGVRFLIDTDYEEDRELADTDDNGAVIIKAMWRNNIVKEPDDGNAPDDKAKLEESGELDLWDSAHAANKAIGYVEDCPDRAAYTKKHGDTGYQYGRVLLNAETSCADYYLWFVKREKDESFSIISGNSAECLFEKLGKDDNHMKVRCRAFARDGDEAASADAGSSFIEYETEITVFTLPEISDTKITVNKTGITPVSEGI